MENATLHFKHMVCDRCIRTVRSTLESLGWKVIQIELGKARVIGLPDKEALNRIRKAMESEGFELVENKDAKLIEEIKTRIIERVHYTEESLTGVNLSEWLPELLHNDYKYLSSFFSKHQGITIEKYYILQRIERVKELLSYDELTLSEISWKTGFSSVHHLSAQFKQITGMAPTVFKKNISRKPLDTI